MSFAASFLSIIFMFLFLFSIGSNMTLISCFAFHLCCFLCNDRYRVCNYLDKIPLHAYCINICLPIKYTQISTTPIPPTSLSPFNCHIFLITCFVCLYLQLAQKLYEGIKLSDDEATGLITYMRTDGLHVGIFFFHLYWTCSFSDSEIYKSPRSKSHFVNFSYLTIVN